MRGTRAPRRRVYLTKGTSSRNSSGAVSSPRRSFWVVNDGGHPKSPLSIERLPSHLKRSMSRVARVKPTIARRRGPPEESFPFYIDKRPAEKMVGGLLNYGQPVMNDSVIVIESPRVSKDANSTPSECPVQQPRRQDSVDTVDLCSDEEDVNVANIKDNKRKKKREVVSNKRRKLCAKPEEPNQPDVIVLDDEDETISRSSNNNASIIVESDVKPSGSTGSTLCSDDVPTTMTTSSSSESHNSKIPCSSCSNPSRRNGKKFWSKYMNKPLSVQVPHNKDTVLSAVVNPGPSCNVNLESNSKGPELSNTVGSNVFNPCGPVQQTGLRPIIIDGCNVAIAHGGNRVFSVRGLCICVEYFLRRGHSQVVALVPLHLRSKVSPQDRDVLESLKSDSHLVFTPSRFIDNRLISSYDDRYIVQYAAAVGGVIVSRDNYRDLLTENSAWRDTITNRLLMPTWVGDVLMFPVDPLGKAGPSLDDFLQFPNK